MDPFAVLGLPRRFGIDLKEAESRHLELSKALHPDRYSSSGAGERRLSLTRAVEVNEAWRILRDPIKRAEAFLKLSGLENEVGETREPKPSGAFLMEVMEAREQLDEAKSARDAGAIAKIVAEAKAQFRDTEAELARMIDASDSPEKLRAAIPVLGRLRYAARFLEEARNAEDDLAGI